MTKANKKVKLNVRVNKTGGREKTVEERVANKEEFIKGFDDKVEHYVENYVERVEKTKMLTLISGVGFFMLLIVFLYIYNFKSQIMSLEVSGQGSDGINIQVDEIKNSIGDIVDSYKDIKNTVNSELKGVSTSTNETNLEKQAQGVLPKASSTKEVNTESINVLKEKLLEKNTIAPIGQE